MRAKLFIGLLVVVWLVGCKKDPPTPSPQPCVGKCNVDTLNILWSDTMSKGFIYQTIAPLLRGNEVIISATVDKNINLQASVIQSRNIHTGEINWESSPTSRNLSASETRYSYYDNKVLINSWDDHFAFDLGSGNTVWNFNLPRSEITCFSIQNKYITSRYYSTMGFPDSLEVLVCDAVTGVCDVAFRQYAKGLRGARVRGHSAYISAQSDLILIIGIDRTEYASGWSASSDIVCYNYTQDTLVWEVVGIEQGGGSALLNIGGYFKIEPENQRVYVMAAKTLYCYDLLSGQEIWRSHFTNTNMLSSNYIIHGDKIVWVDDMGYSIAVNKHTGDLIYRENLKDGAPDRIEAWGNRLITGLSELQLIDLNSGKVLRKAWVPKFGNERWFTSPLIDEANNRMYFTDGYAIICAEIPETWKE